LVSLLAKLSYQVSHAGIDSSPALTFEDNLFHVFLHGDHLIQHPSEEFIVLNFSTGPSQHFDPDLEVALLESLTDCHTPNSDAAIISSNDFTFEEVLNLGRGFIDSQITQ
jgi:hypothetical protein